MTKKQYEVHAFCDPAFQFLCGQIDSDYTTILRRDILPKLGCDETIRLREIRTLMVVDYHTKPASSTVISEYLRFDRGTVSRATKSLKRNGYLESMLNPEDKRSPLLIITESGKVLAERYRQLISEHFANLSAETGDEFTEAESRDALQTLFLLRNRAKQFVDFRENS